MSQRDTPTSASHSAPSGSPTSPQHYVASFDGLRCFAVLTVVCAHLAILQPILAPFGSFMGVDLFFVVSGYLITTQLVRERVTTGNMHLRAFYARRFTRLYPVVTLIIIIALVQMIVAPSSDSTPSWLGIFGIAAYFSNFVALQHAPDLGAWVPLWSLSIEEQFYIFWPCVLLVCLRAASGLRRALTAAFVLTVVMWVWRIYSWQTDPTRFSAPFLNQTDAWHTFYYSTLHRPDGLLVGSMLALILSRPGSSTTQLLIRAAHALRPFVIVGVLLIARFAADGAAQWQVWFGLSGFNILVALLLVELLNYQNSVSSRILRLRPLTWIGRRSYFIYAFHMAAIIAAVEVFDVHRLPGLAATMLAILGAAGLSYRFYENPVRRLGYRWSRALTSG